MEGVNDVALIPEKPALTPEQALGLLVQWDNAKKALAVAQAQEIMLRRQIFGHYFPSPKEGTNTVILPSAYQLKGVHKLNRKVDPAVLTVLTTRPAADQPSRLEQAGVNPGAVFKWEPDLIIKGYKMLTAEQQQVVDLCVTATEGTPALSIEPPSKKATKA